MDAVKSDRCVVVVQPNNSMVVVRPGVSMVIMKQASIEYGRCGKRQVCGGWGTKEICGRGCRAMQ